MTAKSLHLFAVYLGGRAPKCNTELHDVVFTVGTELAATYGALVAKWFGSPRGLHIDSWIQVDHVDGYHVQLSKEPAATKSRLFFVNLGAYIPGRFIEMHENALLVGMTKTEVKRRAKELMCQGMEQIHTDDLLDVDDCIAVDEVDGYYIHLLPQAESKTLKVHSEYKPLPKNVIARYLTQ